jgi:hypothetical protein
MKKFKCHVIKTIECDCTIEIDENQINEEWMKEFRKSFYNYTELKQHAENLSGYVVNEEEYDFIEGYGCVLVDGENPFGDEKYAFEKGINIKDIHRYTDYDFDTEEV